jgi:hypothetical protein
MTVVPTMTATPTRTPTPVVTPPPVLPRVGGGGAGGPDVQVSALGMLGLLAIASAVVAVRLLRRP